MATSVHEGDYGTVITLSVRSDISDATDQKILYEIDDTTGEWQATLGDNGKSIEYVVQPGDIDTVGKWRLQAYVLTPSGAWFGDITTMVVKESL